METKFIDVVGFSIAYIEKNETAEKAVFFIHGNSCSYKIWEKQLNSPLLENYHLIAIDLPGHGYSSHSKNPKEDYSPLGTAAILAQAVKILSNNKPFVLTGLSYGTNLIAEMLCHNVYPRGIVFAGACVLGKGFGMEIFIVDETIYFEKTVNMERAFEFLSSQLCNSDDIPLYVDNYFKTDVNFRPALMESAAEGKVSDEIELLQKSNVRILVINGEKEQTVNPVYMEQTGLKLWKGKVLMIEDAGHFVHTDSPFKFNNLLAVYLNKYS